MAQKEIQIMKIVVVTHNDGHWRNAHSCWWLVEMCPLLLVVIEMPHYIIGQGNAPINWWSVGEGPPYTAYTRNQWLKVPWWSVGKIISEKNAFNIDDQWEECLLTYQKLLITQGTPSNLQRNPRVPWNPGWERLASIISIDWKTLTTDFNQSGYSKSDLKSDICCPVLCLKPPLFPSSLKYISVSNTWAL